MVADARTGIPRALDRLEACCLFAGLAPQAALELRLVAEEVLSNAAKYGFEPGAPPAVELRLSLDEAGAVLEFRDQGRAFDPLALPAPDLTLPIEERALGGLGLPLLRALVDEARYERLGATNVLRLVKHRAAQ